MVPVCPDEALEPYSLSFVKSQSQKQSDQTVKYFQMLFFVNQSSFLLMCRPDPT
ncbi:hypothetical protein HanIR_Chr08g0371231 [Helianthus annuus]|nr:hypothetical protein HanIR_Chr08g0371231 [Helianthus annuus]